MNPAKIRQIVWIVRINDSIHSVCASKSQARKHMHRYMDRNSDQFFWKKIDADRWYTPHARYTIWNEKWQVTA